VAIVETEAVNLMESDICSGLIKREGGYRRIAMYANYVCVVFAQQSMATNLRGIATPCCLADKQQKC